MLRLIVDLIPRHPSRGLALEEALLESTKLQGTGVLRFWVNNRSVIIGRSQSAASEADLPLLQARSIPVIRRLSGGGAVYHYSGNLNISAFLTADCGLSTISETYAAFGQVLVQILSQLDVESQVNANSVMIGKKKIAGAAQVRRKSVVLYHTTFLVAPPAIPVDSILLAMQNNYHTPGVASSPMPIVSLSQLVPQVTAKDLIVKAKNGVEKLFKLKLEEGYYSSKELDHAKILQHEKYGSDRWNLSH